MSILKVLFFSAGCALMLGACAKKSKTTTVKTDHGYSSYYVSTDGATGMIRLIVAHDQQRYLIEYIKMMGVPGALVHVYEYHSGSVTTVSGKTVLNPEDQSSCSKERPLIASAMTLDDGTTVTSEGKTIATKKFRASALKRLMGDIEDEYVGLGLLEQADSMKDLALKDGYRACFYEGGMSRMQTVLPAISSVDFR